MDQWIHHIPGQHRYNGVVYLESQPVEVLERVSDFHFTPEDVLVATYPKSGTTWMCELADVIVQDGDTTKASRGTIQQRWPFLEFGTESFNVMSNTHPPRLIRTHMQAQYFEKQIREQGVKTIYVLRNPKDAFVSYFHMHQSSKMMNEFTGSWDDFFQVVKGGQLLYGNWFDHTIGWWALRDLPNVITFTYEGMLKDTKGSVKRLAAFLGKSFTEEVIDNIVHHVSFDEMKKNPLTNFSTSSAANIKVVPFMRKGKAGDWKNYFSKEQNEYVDNLMKERIEGTGIEVSFE